MKKTIVIYVTKLLNSRRLIKILAQVFYLCIFSSITLFSQLPSDMPIIPPCPDDSFRERDCPDQTPPYDQWDWKGPKLATKTIFIPSCQISCTFKIQYYDREIICWSQGNEVNRWYDINITYIQYEDNCWVCVNNYENEILILL